MLECLIGVHICKVLLQFVFIIIFHFKVFIFDILISFFQTSGVLLPKGKFSLLEKIFYLWINPWF